MNDPAVDAKQFYIEVFSGETFDPEDIRCLWVLSTGRCGTQTLDGILSACPGMISFHEPMPRLHSYQSMALHDPKPDLLRELVHASRIDITSFAHRMGKVYAECQHRWTYYAPFVKEVFLKAKFIWLMRDMDEFVRSAIQWHWYDLEQDKYITNRVLPADDCEDQGKLLAWYWCRTNEFIRDFVNTLPADDWAFLDFKQIKEHNLYSLLKPIYELGFDQPHGWLVEKILNEKRNRGKREQIEKGWGDFDDRAKRIYESANR